MSTPIWLTDEDSEIIGYKRAKVPFSPSQVNKSDCPSLVRAVTTTTAGPATIPVNRTVGSAVFNQGWITDPLNGPALSNGNWILHCWAFEDNAAANAGIQFSVSKYGGSSIVSATTATELGTVTADVALTSGAATPQNLVEGDRLLITISITDVGGTMVAGHSVTVSYNGLYTRSEGDTYVIAPDDFTVIGSQSGATIVGDIPDDDILAVRTILQDASSQLGLSTSPTLADSDVVRYIIQAVETYSVDRPFVASYYYSGDANTFNFPMPPRFIWQFSRIITCEYPADQQIPNTLEYLDWEIRDQVLGLQPVRFIRLRTIIPDLGSNNFYVQYSTRHLYSTEFSTIPREDLDAVLWLAGSYCAAAISSKFAGATDSSIEADVVNYRDSMTKWQNVSKFLKELYLNRVVEPDSATPVGSLEEWRPQNETGQATLWHSRRIRRVFY